MSACATPRDYTVKSLPPSALEPFLDRQRRSLHDELTGQERLAENLVEILNKANEFVPSDAGSILLDDPKKKDFARERNSLTYIAAFGEKAEPLIGQRISATQGIAGHCYRMGSLYHTAQAHRDRHHLRAIDEATDFTTKALVAVPIRLGDDVCGVLELIRERPYTDSECTLLEIFAGYLSVSIQNVLDARYALNIARRDNLTGLYNDRYLHIALAQTLDRCRRTRSDLAVVFLDLDFFKRINDSHGHLAGSQVLREVGQLLQRVAEPRSGIACRYGGDEFVLILPGCGLEQAIDQAEELRTMVAASTFCAEAGTIQADPLHLRGLTCSIGIATLHRHDLPHGEGDEQRQRTTLLHLADAAMYVAKETGRNRTAVAGDPVPRRESLSGRSRDAERLREQTPARSPHD